MEQEKVKKKLLSSVKKYTDLIFLLYVILFIFLKLISELFNVSFLCVEGKQKI